MGHIGHEKDEVCLEVKSTELYKDYVNYCDVHLMCQAETMNSFGRQMHDRLNFESRRRSVGIHYIVYCDKDNRFNVKR